MQILARWQRPVASRMPLDLSHWVMYSAPYRLIPMATEMAHKADACFSVIDFIACITVAKLPYFGRLKIKPSNNIVPYYVFILFIYYGGLLTTINSVLAIIANGGRVIVVIDREAVEIFFFLL